MTAPARAAAFVLVGLVLGQSDVRVQGPDPAHATSLARRATDRIRALQREADALVARERGLLGDLRRLEVERALRTEEYAEAARERDQIQRDLEAMVARIAELQRRARTQLPDLAGRLVQLYKLGDAGYVRLLLSVDDLRELGRAYRFVSALQHIDRQRIEDHQRTLTELQQARRVLEQRQVRQIAVQAEMATARDAAVDDIDARRDLNARLVGELRDAQDRLQRAVADMATGSGGEATVVALPIRPFRGDLDWPVTGPVAARFGRQRHPRFHTSVANNGILVTAAFGTPVRAIHEGTVAFADSFPGFGNLVIVDHGNLGFTMYGHLSDIAAPVGRRVERGQVVGSVGSTIDGTPALYFELRIDGKPVDPLQWLRKR
jgi:septal ring factor EnvC (AmiA/AmiB activator)